MAATYLVCLTEDWNATSRSGRIPGIDNVFMDLDIR